MKTRWILALIGLIWGGAAQAGAVRYQVDGQPFEGYYLVAADKQAPLVVLVHDWDGLNDYEIKRAEMLVDRAKIRKLLQAGLAEAGKQGGRLDNAVVLGYCFGGAAVLELARSGASLKGVVSVHGGLETPAGQDYKQTRASLLIQHGSADQAVSLGQFAALITELESAGIRHEATSYSGAPHAFSVFGSDNYRADADAKSWRRFTEFLGEVTKG